ncbi:MAG: hypothetical protein ABFD25_04530 [Clostridiaceae bacterium]
MSIDFSQFSLFIPPPKPSQYAINITASGYVNLNDKLKLRIPAYPDGDSGGIRTVNRKHPDTLSMI